ncbi:MAG: hypothetical protein ACREOJ_08525 [Gemmatimonadaceae bacterium]
MDDHATNDPDHPTFVMRLCNFATGKAGLLDPSHHVAIRDRLLPAIWSYERCFIDVLGYASRLKYSHNPSGNLSLSRARSIAVVDYLRTMLSAMDLKFRFNVVDGRGDSDSYRDSDANLGFRRAALIRVFCQGKYNYRPPPPLRHGYTTVATDQFVFQAIESASVSGGLFEANHMFFSIHDQRNGRIRYFSYQSIGLSAPIKGLPAIMASAEHKSTPVPFTTRCKILDLEDFAGNAELEGSPGVTLNTLSLGGRATLTMHPKAYADRSIGNPLVVSFSFSRGFGANLKDVAAGSVKILDESFRPAVYPD